MNTNAPAHPWLLVLLAALDLWHDRKVSFCMVASLVAVIAPLLLLFGLKYGVVSQLNHELLSDPRNLEVRLSGNHNLPLDWFKRWQAMPEVAFVMPLTRTLNTEASLLKDNQHFLADVELIPTGRGDPLLSGLEPPKSGELLLSASTANRLQVQTGESLKLLVQRQLEGKNQRGQMDVKVRGILPASTFARPAALLDLDTLVATEDFRDGFATPLLGINKGQSAPPRSHYARARLYAKNLNDVAPLAARLASEHIESQTRASEIESVQAISRVLNLIFAVIAWTALLGAAFALGGALLASIERKRREFALLRLIGFSRRAIAYFVVIQAALLALLAFILALLLYSGGSAVFNSALGANLESTGFVCRLTAQHLLLAFAATMLLSGLVAAMGGWRATRIEAAESLRSGI